MDRLNADNRRQAAHQLIESMASTTITSKGGGGGMRGLFASDYAPVQGGGGGGGRHGSPLLYSSLREERFRSNQRCCAVQSMTGRRVPSAESAEEEYATAAS